PAQAGLHDPAEPMAADDAARSGRRHPGAGARARARPVEARGRRPARERAPRRRAHARRPHLDARRPRAVDARVPRWPRRLEIDVRALSLLMVSDVSPLNTGGGAERLLWEQARWLARRGHAVKVACIADCG